MQQEPLLTWWAYEYPLKERGSDWFWSLGILTLSLFVTAILLKNFLFAVLILISGVLLVLFSLRKPRVVTFEIFDNGILIEKHMYLFKDLDAFFIDQTHPEKLLLQSKRLLVPILALPLENTDPHHVREIMEGKLKEKELEESLAVHLLERLGF